MKNYFTSDWHLGDDRIGINGKPNLFYRPFNSVEEQNHKIFFNMSYYSPLQNGDTIWHLGDVCVNDVEQSIKIIERIKQSHYNNGIVCKWNLIIGNYDEDKLEALGNVFDTFNHSAEVEIKGRKYYLNHYPVNCVANEFSITGHIHGLWKVQKNMINVGVDAWHFKMVSEDEIDFCRTACEKYYDKNVFPY